MIGTELMLGSMTSLSARSVTPSVKTQPKRATAPVIVKAIAKSNEDATVLGRREAIMAAMAIPGVELVRAIRFDG
jgi:hypothetical protein